MDNPSCNEFIDTESPAIYDLNRQCICPSKLNKVESIMIYCLDNQQRLKKKPSLIVSQSDIFTQDFSLNRLFDLAKEEHVKKQTISEMVSKMNTQLNIKY